MLCSSSWGLFPLLFVYAELLNSMFSNGREGERCTLHLLCLHSFSRVAVNEAGSSGCRSNACAVQLSLRKAWPPLPALWTLLFCLGHVLPPLVEKKEPKSKARRRSCRDRPEPVQAFRASFHSTTKV